MTYEKLKNACRFVRNGAEYLSTHPDPTYFWKTYKETVEMICETTGMKKTEMCFFGDRLYTDIAIGKKHGVTAILVYTGETQPIDVEKADDCNKPDLIFESLADVDKIMFH